jgi:hypothetical protein
MRIEANKDTLASIRNLVLRAYAERYVNIERDFMDQIRLPKTLFFSQKNYFLKSAKVFGEDVATVEQFFHKTRYKDYEVNKEYNYLEFHVSQIRALKKFDIEIGLSSNVLKTREGERYIRELKVDVTSPLTFRLSADI